MSIGKFDIYDLDRNRVMLVAKKDGTNKRLGRFRMILSRTDLDNVNVEKLSRRTLGKGEQGYGYWQDREKVTYLVHRIVVGFRPWDGIKGYDVHHHRKEDGIEKTLNNARENLYILTRQQHRKLHKMEDEENKDSYAWECDQRNREALGFVSREEFLKEEVGEAREGITWLWQEGLKVKKEEEGKGKMIINFYMQADKKEMYVYKVKDSYVMCKGGKVKQKVKV